MNAGSFADPQFIHGFYDRALLLESNRAVIDRTYSGINAHTQSLCKAIIQDTVADEALAAFISRTRRHDSIQRRFSGAVIVLQRILER